MTTARNESATTWRDLADQLRPEQLAAVEKSERGFIDGGIVADPRAAEKLVDIARDYVTANIADAAYSDVPVPTGATVDSSGWCRNLDQPGFSRFLVWYTVATGVDDVSVDVDGRQSSDGSFTRRVTLFAENPELSAEQARGLAGALIEAAYEMDRLGAL